jgi:hypothetical protein
MVNNMKHIKLYEVFNSEDYYKHISLEYAAKLIGPYYSDKGNENIVEFTDKEINKIMSIYNNKEFNAKKPSYRYGVEFQKSNGSTSPRFDSIPESVGAEGKYDIKLYHLGVFGKRELLDYQSVYKLEDDWFILNTQPNNYYRCDQLDGLIKCMEDHKMKFPPKDI